MKISYYTHPVSDVYGKVGSAPSGLTLAEVDKRLKDFGPNILPAVKNDSWITIFVRQFKNPLTILLMLCVMLTYYIHDTADAIILLAVIFTDVSVGFFQEFKATKSIASLTTFLTPQSIVLRSGSRMTIDARNIVPGDIVLLAAGSKVPADIRLTQAYDLAVDESLLTGESVPVEKNTKRLADADIPVADRINMAFSGTVVVRGSGRGIVVATAGNTELGSIASAAGTIRIDESPLTRKFELFSKKIGVFVAAGAAVVFLLGITSGYSLTEVFTNVVAVSVAAVPEGLPLVVTAALAVTIQKMAAKKTIIRHLPAAETLGSCTVICTDKTGTLTKNEMTVKKLYDGAEIYDVTGDGYTPLGSIMLNGMKVQVLSNDRLRMLLTVGLLCNESGISVSEDTTTVHGDPTEIAIILSAYKAGLHKETERLRYPKIAVLPFDSGRGCMATLHNHKGKRFIFVKGTPEKVAQLSDADASDVEKTSGELARDGLRVLAFAYKEIDMQDELSDNDIRTGFTFLGLSAMIDPPRPEVYKAIKDCQDAGIRVVMVTGDHALTAGAIAKQLDITEDPDAVITGYELTKMSDEEMSASLTDINVFARISPEQKLRIVSVLKKKGEIVAVTGDGINDAPALKAAHIGVAMGTRGTDVAKEVADMVILDDNFATIVGAIREARILFANIQKATMFLLPTGFAGICTVIATMALKIPAPYTALQLLWINLVTSGLQDVALAFEPGEKGVLRRKPRKQTAGIVTKLLAERSIIVTAVITIGVLFVYLLARHEGESTASARTIATTTMVVFQFFQVANSRSETRSILNIPLLGNPMLFITMVLAVLVQGLAIFFRPLMTFLGTTPMSPQTLAWSILVASSVIIIVETDKYLRSRHVHRQS